MGSRKRKDRIAMPPIRGIGVGVPPRIACVNLSCEPQLTQALWESEARPNWVIHYQIGGEGMKDSRYSKTMVPACLKLEIIAVLPVGTTRVMAGCIQATVPTFVDAAWEVCENMESSREKIKRGATYGPRVVTWGTGLDQWTAQTFAVKDDAELPGPAPRLMRPVFEGPKVVDWHDADTEIDPAG